MAMSRGKKLLLGGGKKRKSWRNSAKSDIVPSVAASLKSSAVRGERVRWQDITLAERGIIDRVLAQRGWNEALIVEFWKDVAKEMGKLA